MAWAAVAGAVALILWLESAGLIFEELVLPILLVAAVLGLLGSLAGMIPMYHRATLTTPEHALGLPPGSVRALIAVSFIIMFLITAVFLQIRSGVSDRGVLEGVTPEEFAVLQANDGIVVLDATLDEGGTTRTVEIGIRPTENETQFADRMFSTVSTIVVALTAFYFGNRSVVTARQVLGGGASITIASPPEDEAYLPEPGEELTVRVTCHPPDATIAGEATSGELVRLEGQPGAFRFTAASAVGEATLSFHLPDHPQADRVSITLQRRPEEPEAGATPGADLDEDESPWLPPPESTGDWDDAEAAWIDRITEADEADKPE